MVLFRLLMILNRPELLKSIYVYSNAKTVGVLRPVGKVIPHEVTIEECT